MLVWCNGKFLQGCFHWLIVGSQFSGVKRSKKLKSSKRRQSSELKKWWPSEWQRNWRNARTRSKPKFCDEWKRPSRLWNSKCWRSWKDVGRNVSKKKSAVRYCTSFQLCWLRTCFASSDPPVPVNTVSIRIWICTEGGLKQFWLDLGRVPIIYFFIYYWPWGGKLGVVAHLKRNTTGVGKRSTKVTRLKMWEKLLWDVDEPRRVLLGRLCLANKCANHHRSPTMQRSVDNHPQHRTQDELPPFRDLRLFDSANVNLVTCVASGFSW